MNKLIAAFATSFLLLGLNAQDQDPVATVETTQEVAANDEAAAHDDVAAPQDCGCGKKK